VVGIHDGEKFAKDLQYAPLPDEIIKRAEARSIDNGGRQAFALSTSSDKLQFVAGPE